MQTIHKYQLPVIGPQIVAMPLHARILSAGRDPAGNLCVWADVNTLNPTAEREIVVLGTGSTIEEGVEIEFIDTVIMGKFVWHVFEIV